MASPRTRSTSSTGSYEFLSIRHLGMIQGGVEDVDSEAVRAWGPAHENYTFRAVDGGTEVLVEQDAPEDFAASLSACWSKAFARLKELCERGG